MRASKITPMSPACPVERELNSVSEKPSIALNIVIHQSGGSPSLRQSSFHRPQSVNKCCSESNSKKLQCRHQLRSTECDSQLFPDTSKADLLEIRT